MALSYFYDHPIQLAYFLHSTLPNYSDLVDIGKIGSHHYFRVTQSGVSYLLLDASEHPETAMSFKLIATGYAQAGITAPQILEDDLDSGYLLIADWGEDRLRSHLKSAPDIWLPQTINTLLLLQNQGGQHILELPEYDASQLLSELSLFHEWFLTEFLNEKLSSNDEALINDLSRRLTDNATNQPKSWVHGSFNSQSMVKTSSDQLVLTHIEQTRFGPMTYDIASLLKDFCVDYPAKLIEKQLENYYIHTVTCEKYPHDFERLCHDTDLMSIHYHLKSLGKMAKHAKHQPSKKIHAPLKLFTCNH